MKRKDAPNREYPLEDAHYAGQSPESAGPFMETGRTDPPSPELDGDMASATMPSDALLEDNIHPSEQRGFYNAEDREEAIREGGLEEDRHVNNHLHDKTSEHEESSGVTGIEEGSVNATGLNSTLDEGSASIGAEARELKNEHVSRRDSNAVSEGRIPAEMADEAGAPGADPNLGPAPFGEEVEPVIDNYESNITRDRIDERHRTRFL